MDMRKAVSFNVATLILLEISCSRAALWKASRLRMRANETESATCQKSELRETVRNCVLSTPLIRQRNDAPFYSRDHALEFGC